MFGRTFRIYDEKFLLLPNFVTFILPCRHRLLNARFIQVYPHGTAGGNGEFITVFLILKDYSPVQVDIAYNFRIGPRYPNVGYHRRTFKMAGDSCGHIVICRTMLFEPTNGFLVDDKLIITCRMVVNNPMMYDNVFLSDLERAFAEDDLKDCELIGNDGTVRACKALLSSQSRVFSRMFQGELKEAETDKVENIGFDQKVLTELVRYTHCGKPGDIKEIAEDLFEAADKYDIELLMVLCAQHMKETFSKENVCARLVIADRHRVDSLKNAAINFIKENISDIKELVGYKELLTTEHQDLIIEIFNALHRSDCESCSSAIGRETTKDGKYLL
jgi:hypothetical protein